MAEEPEVPNGREGRDGPDRSDGRAVPDGPRVRPAREAEIDQVAELWAAMYAYQREHGMLLPLRDDAAEIWKRQLAGRLDAPVSVILVAEVPGAPGLSGFLAAQTKRLPPHLAAARSKVGFISEMYVCPDLRRHRVGRALVDAAFDWFARADVGSIELHVLIQNAVARAFWASVGFEAELVQMRAPSPRASAATTAANPAAIATNAATATTAATKAVRADDPA